MSRWRQLAKAFGGALPTDISEYRDRESLLQLEHFTVAKVCFILARSVSVTPLARQYARERKFSFLCSHGALSPCLALPNARQSGATTPKSVREYLLDAVYANVPAPKFFASKPTTSEVEGHFFPQLSRSHKALPRALRSPATNRNSRAPGAAIPSAWRRALPAMTK